MATKKITELPLIQTISGSFSVVPIVIGNTAGNGTTDQITIENFSRFVTQYSAHTGSAGNTFTGPQIINSNVTSQQMNQLKGMFKQMRQDKTADDADNALFERLQRLAGL